MRRTAAGGGGEALPGPPVAAGRRSDSERARDEVNLSSPDEALRKLVRERILSATRRRLAPMGASARPTVRPVEIAFASASDLEAYVGQIRARQALLIASSGERLSPPDAACLIREAALEGLANALDLLHEVERLDAHTWRSVVAIHHTMLAHGV